jgi:hypothetical protein
LKEVGHNNSLSLGTGHDSALESAEDEEELEMNLRHVTVQITMSQNSFVRKATARGRDGKFPDRFGGQDFPVRFGS